MPELQEKYRSAATNTTTVTFSMKWGRSEVAFFKTLADRGSKWVPPCKVSQLPMATESVGNIFMTYPATIFMEIKQGTIYMLPLGDCLLCHDQNIYYKLPRAATWTYAPAIAPKTSKKSKDKHRPVNVSKEVGGSFLPSNMQRKDYRAIVV